MFNSLECQVYHKLLKIEKYSLSSLVTKLSRRKEQITNDRSSSVGLYGSQAFHFVTYVAINIIPNLYYFVVLANAVVNCKMLSISTMICLKKDFH